MDEWTVLNWFGEINYSVMQWSDRWWWWCWVLLFFLGTFIGMSPLSVHKDLSFHEIIGVWTRRIILATTLLLLSLPFIMLYIYDMTMQKQLGDHTRVFSEWFFQMSRRSPFESLEWIGHWFLVIPAMIIGWSLRFCYNRYYLTFISSIKRKLRRRQSDDALSDIQDEKEKYHALTFEPSKHYAFEKGIFVGLDEDKKPIYIPLETWHETNMQVIGPTRYGKGVILGVLMDQIIRMNEGLFYIDPKNDRFAAHVMYQACNAAGRKFYYVSMDDSELGKWGPFMGGSEADAFSRLEVALGLELTGDPGTDYYKTQEIPAIRNVFKTTRRLDAMFEKIRNLEANKTEAELRSWKEIDSLCPKANKGFSIEKAIKENAVVYFKGSLDNRIIKTATKMFIVELVQECRRLFKSGEKTGHLTAVVDEVSFLASRQLKEALATIVGFEVNFVNAYQSPEDLINTDDINLNGHALKHSIDVNSQLKAIYGGADFATAEWASKLSGTVVKEVTRMERTDVKPGGGETWENNRMIGSVEENLIHPNVILTLPPRVCVFIQPRELLRPLFTSFVPVKDTNSLQRHLDNHSVQLEKAISDDDIEPENKAFSHAKTPGADDSQNNDVSHFQEMAESTPSINSAFLPGHSVGEEPKPLPELIPENEPFSHAKTDIQNTPTSDEIERKRLKNRERKAKQKLRKKEGGLQKTDEEKKSVVMESITEPDIATDTDDALKGFLDNVQNDEESMKILSETED